MNEGSRIDRRPGAALAGRIAAAGLAVTLAFSLGVARAQVQFDADSPAWLKVRASVFGDRRIETDAGSVVELEAPARAEDAAVVPLTIRTRLPQTSERFVRRIYLVIDRNPSPLGAVFTFTPESGRADIETRVRIEDYTHVRAIAETSDGSLYMATRYVKASGGCSAPAGKDAAAALARLGRIKFFTPGEVQLDQPNL
ncbi:MAG TPA: quinoprotein dehydrogenase-associated SoxYZ-like carrier, partial [Burkholderiaceae bacterium]